MKNLALLLIALLALSCEKEDVKSITTEVTPYCTNTSISIFGILKNPAKYKYLVVSETPNVTEASGKTSVDSASNSTYFNLSASFLNANTTYYYKIYYRNTDGGITYSPEYSITTKNDLVTTEFGALYNADTLQGGVCHFRMKYTFTKARDFRGAEFGICYSTSSEYPTLDNHVVKGIPVSSTGEVECDMSSISFSDRVKVRSYLKTTSGVEYGATVVYAKRSWMFCAAAEAGSAGSVVYNNTGYSISCENGSTASICSLNRSSMAWSKAASFSATSFFNIKAAPLANGFMFTHGYCFARYNASTNTVKEVEPTGILNDHLRSPYLDVFRTNGKTYVFIYPYRAPESCIYSFDEATETFTLESTNPKCYFKDNAALFAVGNTIYVGGGVVDSFDGANDYGKDFWSYNLETKEWKQLKDAPSLSFYRSFVYKNRCLAFASDGYMYEYLPDSDTWKVLGQALSGSVLPFDDALYGIDSKSHMLKCILF